MISAIFLVIAAVIGIIYGTAKRIKALTIASATVLVLIAALAIYIYFNPY